MRPALALLAGLAWLAAAPAAPAQDAPARPIEVDVELVLMVDVSRSMSPAELEIQRRGYAEALTSPHVLAAINEGLLGRIAVTYVEWAGSWNQRVIVEWRLLAGREDAEAIAGILRLGAAPGMRRTSISGALMTGAEMIEGNGFEGLRKVIDISGDGPNNEGGPVESARDSVLARGIIVNGLPLMTQDEGYFGGTWSIPDLDRYYEACVIGGPGAFVLPVTSWERFAEAVRRKLVLELAGRVPDGGPERLWQAQAERPEPYDCLVGEKMWQQRMRDGWEP